MKNYLIIGALVFVAAVSFYVWKTQSSPQSPSKSNESAKTQSSDTQTVSFSSPQKSAHYESNTPAHGSVLAGVPVNIVIDFNFDLAKPSTIEIVRDVSPGSSQPESGNKIQSADYSEGETIIDPNKLSMRRSLALNAPDGLFTIKYNACWPDGSCHDGSFQFAIDRTLASQFTDQTRKKEVTIKLSQTQFNPQNIKVSRGTKVVWVNDDSAEHYVNTDSHPAHTYYPEQNSKLLKKGENYSLTFNKSGIYPYHCSTHASIMTGTLLVE